nr:uncharacterized protein LOC120973709 [Aegilops tauschii subsp. strangulata]
MSASSSCRSSRRGGGPFIPLIYCLWGCGSMVKKHVSGTEDHPGWVYYCCPGHGNECNFWRIGRRSMLLTWRRRCFSLEIMLWMQLGGLKTGEKSWSGAMKREELEG